MTPTSITLVAELITVDPELDLRLLARGESIDPTLERFVAGDWGDVSDELRLANEDAVYFGDGLVTGRYVTPIGIIAIEHDPEDQTTEVSLETGAAS